MLVHLWNCLSFLYLFVSHYQVNAFMAVFGIVQLILSYITFLNCSTDAWTADVTVSRPLFVSYLILSSGLELELFANPGLMIFG